MGPKFFRKVVSAALAATLLFLDLPADVFESPAGTAYADHSSGSSPAKNKIQIPEKIGTVLDSFSGEKPFFIVLLEDIHCVPSAQIHLAEIVDLLHQKYSISFAALEGASERVNPSSLFFLPDPKTKKEVLDLLLEEGIITGVEYLMAWKNPTIELWGAENRELYLENLVAYQQSQTLNRNENRILNTIHKNIKLKKKEKLPKALYRLDKLYWKYDRNPQFLKLLIAEIQKASGSQKKTLPSSVLGYLNLTKLDSRIDAASLQKEVSGLIEILTRNKPREATSDIIKLSLYLRLGKISESEYFSALSRRAEKSGMSLRPFPLFQKYLKLLKLKALFDLNKLHTDIKNFVKNSFPQEFQSLWNDTALERMYRSLFSLQLPYADWNIFRGIPKDEKQNWFRRYAPLNSEKILKRKLELCAAFYHAAMKRNAVLTQNMLEKMREEGISSSVMIAGGFHKDGILEILKEQNISYCVISPKVEGDLHSNYRELLLGRISPLEKILLKNISSPGISAPALVPALRTAENPLTGSELRTMLLKKASLFYLLLNAWESGGKTPAEIVQELKESFTAALSSAERMELESFLDSLHMGRISNSEKNEIWIEGALSGRSVIFIVGKEETNQQKQEHIVSQPIAGGTLSKLISYKIFLAKDMSGLPQKKEPFSAKAFFERLKTALINRFSLAGLAGLGTGITAMHLFAYATFLNPNYVFGRNFLSVLGESQYSWPFNLSTFVAGGFLAWFGWISLKPVLEPNLRTKIGLAALSISGIFLMLVGVFPSNLGLIHLVVAGGFFIAISVGLLLLYKYMARSPVLGLPVAIVAVIASILSITFVVTFDPRIETAAAFAHLVGILITSCQLLKYGLKKWSGNIQETLLASTKPADILPTSGSRSEIITETVSSIPEEKWEALTVKVEAITEESVKKLIQNTATREDIAAQKWPNAIQELKKMLSGWLSGQAPLMKIPGDFSEKALIEINQIAAAFPHFKDTPYLSVIGRLIGFASDELRENKENLVRPPELALRAAYSMNAENWARFLLNLDFQYDHPLFTALIEKNPGQLAMSINESVGISEETPRVLLWFFRMSRISEERLIEFSRQLSSESLGILLNEIVLGKSLMGGNAKLKSLASDWLLILSEKTGQNPYQILTDQARSILSFTPDHRIWLNWLSQAIPRIPADSAHQEKLLQEMKRLDESVVSEPLKETFKNIKSMLMKTPVTGAVALKPSSEVLRQIAEGRIIGRRISIQGLTAEQYDWLAFKTRNIMAQYPDFDFSDVTIRVVEGAKRLAEIDGRTITLDARVFQSRTLLNLELAHEFLELIASRTKLGFAKPAVREAVMLLLEVYEYKDLPLTQKSEILEALMRSEGMDQGKFLLFLYSSLNKSERKAIRVILDKNLSDSQKTALDQIPERAKDTEIINTALDYLEQDIYPPSIQTYVGENKSGMVKKIQEELALFLLHLKTLQTLSLVTFLGRAAKDKFPNASAAQIRKWIQIEQQEISKQEKRDKSIFIKTAFVIAGTALGLLLLVQSQILIGTSFVLAIGAILGIGLLFVYLSAQTIRNLWSDLKISLEKWNPVSFDAKNKVIHVNPLGYPKRIAKGFEQALNQLEKELENTYRDILQYAVEKQPDAVVFTDSPAFQEPSGVNEWSFINNLFLIRVDDETVWGYDVQYHQFIAIETKAASKSLRILSDSEKEKLAGMLFSLSEFSELPFLKELKDSFPSLKQGSPTLRKTWTRSPAVLAKGSLKQREFIFDTSPANPSEISSWEKDLNKILESFLKSYPAIRWNGIQIQVVRGNDRLAHFDERGTRRTITLDADAFKSKALLKLELTHELIHVIMKDIPRKVPPAIEEIIVIRYMTDSFRDLPPEEQKEILTALRNDPDLDDQSSWKLYFMRLGPQGRHALLKQFETDPEILQDIESIERYTIRGLDEAIIGYVTRQDASGRGTYAPVLQEYLTLKADETTRQKVPRDKEDVFKELEKFQIPIKEIFTITDDIRDLIVQLKDQKNFMELRWQLLRKTSFLLNKLFKIYGTQARSLSIRVANAAILNIRRLKDAKAVPYLLREYMKITEHFDDLPREADIQEFLDNLKWLIENLGSEKTAAKLEGYIRLSRLYFDRAKFKDAGGISLAAIELFPNSVELHIITGDTFLNQGEQEKALKYYQKALQINSNHPAAHERLGSFYSKGRDFELSYAHQRKAKYLSRRIEYNFKIPFENIKQAASALIEALSKKPGRSKEIAGVWAQAVIDDDLFKNVSDLPDLDDLKESKALIAEELLSRNKAKVQAEFEWANQLLKEIGSTVDSSFSVQFNTTQQQWLDLRQKVKKIFESRKQSLPVNLAALSQNPAGWEIFQQILRLGGPGLESQEPGLGLRKKLFERLAKGNVKITRITETVEARESLKDAVPNWMQTLIPSLTSPFKVRQPSKLYVSVVSRGRYIFGQFRFLGLSNANLENALRKIFGAFPQKALNMKKISIRIVKNYDRLARIDLHRHILYVDERLLEYPELLDLELMEEFSHIVIRQHQDEFKPALTPAFEEIAALSVKIDYFKSLDPLEQAKILIDLTEHPEWDLGNFALILASVLSSRRQLAVLSAIQSYYGKNVPATIFANDAENTDITESLAGYLLSSDSDDNPIYPDEITSTLIVKNSIARAGYTAEAVRHLFRKNDIHMRPAESSSTAFRENFLAEIDSKMDSWEREMYLASAFLSAFSDNPENPPTRRDWFRAYIQFVLPYAPISPEIKNAAFYFLKESDENSFQSDVTEEWYAWIQKLRILQDKAPQEGMALQRVLNFPAIFSDAAIMAGQKASVSQQWMLAKMIEFLEKRMQQLALQRSNNLNISERGIIDAFIQTLLRTDHEQILAAFAQLDKHPSEFYPATQMMQRLFISRTGELQNLIRQLVFLKFGRSYGIAPRLGHNVTNEFFNHWLTPIIADPSFSVSLHLDISRMKIVHVESLADTLRDFAGRWNQGRRDMPFLMTFKTGDEEVSVIVFLSRELDAAKLSRAQAFLTMQMDLGDFWVNRINYSAYHVSTFLTSVQISPADRKRFMKLIAEKMAGRLAKLAGQLLDYQYYAGRLEIMDENAFEPAEKSAPPKTLFEDMLSLSPERFEELKRKILDDFVKREMKKLEPFLSEGMTREGIKMAGNYQIFQVLSLFNFSPEQSFNEMRENSALAPVYQSWLEAWGKSSVKSAQGVLDLQTYQIDFETEYVRRLWNLGSDQAQPAIERLIALIEPEMNVQILPSVVYTDEKPEGIIYNSSIQKVLINKKGWVRNPLFLMHLARIPEKIWREVLPHLHYWQLEHIAHAGRLLKELDYQQEGEYLIRISERSHRFVPFLRTIYDFVNRRITDWKLKPYERLAKNVAELAQAWQLKLRESTPMSEQVLTYITLNSVESFLHHQGYDLNRLVLARNGVRVYEARHAEKGDVWITLAAGSIVSASPAENTSLLPPGLLIEAENIPLDIGAAAALPARYEVWNAQPLEEWLKMEIHHLDIARSNMNLLKDIFSVIQSPPEISSNETFPKFWATPYGSLVLHPSLFWKKGTQTDMDWQKELLPFARQIIKSLAQYVPPLVKASMKHADDAAAHIMVYRLIEQQMRQLEKLIQEPSPDLEALAQVARQLFQFWREFENFSGRSLKLLPPAGVSEIGYNERAVDQAA